MMLVLSLFPGIGLLDRAFEDEGFCLVRGPDLLWGGDIKRFHPPRGIFSGVIGGPPCQPFSQMRHTVEANGAHTAPNLIPEFERCVVEAAPNWFLMENVPDAPEPRVSGYTIKPQIIRDVWVGGDTNRLRTFSFGTSDQWRCDKPALRWHIQTLALHKPDPDPTVIAGHGLAPGQRDRAGGLTVMPLSEMCRLQGLPEDFLEQAPFTTHGKRKVIGNGVPLAMGHAVARAVHKAIEPSPIMTAASVPDHMGEG